MKCSQETCEGQAVGYVIWPDGRPVYGCPEHLRQTAGILGFLGSAAPVVMLPPEEKATP